ncbi:MAG: restriction endonuclease [Rhodoferax sp.]|nr:restriction endonuclease [Rhodoferax sp.]
MESSPVLNIVAAGLRIPGWLALAAGLALLGIHRFTKAKITQATPTTQIEPEATATHRPETSWSPAVFANIEWRRFEAVCEKLFGQAGFETKSQSHGADGGVDISTAGRGF